jgi:DNA-binding NtrC family response regulator
VEQKPKLLLADLDRDTRALCHRMAEGLECELLVAADSGAVLAHLKREEVSVVLLDTRTLANALEILREIKEKSARIEVMIADERATIPRAIMAVKAGASEYLEKPLNADVLETALVRALERYRKFQPSVATFGELQRRAIQEAIAQADGDKLEAARLLSIGKTTLYRKLRAYGNHEPKGAGGGSKK